MHLRRLLALAVSVLAAGPAAAEQITHINGTVSASGTTTLLVGITVEAYDATGSSASKVQTAAGGVYHLSVLSGGTYRVLAYDLNGTYATSYFSNATSFDNSTQLKVTDPLNGVDFEMVKGVQASGRVSSFAGAVLPGMVVAAYNSDGSRRGLASTDGNGAFALVLPPGTYRFVAYDDLPQGNPDYSASFYPGQSSFDAAAPTAVPKAGINFVLLPAATVTGNTSDLATRLPLSSLSIEARTPAGDLVSSTTTGVGGRFAMILAPGDYKFLAFDAAKHYAVSYFRDAASFASAPSFHLTAGPSSVVDFFMSAVPPPGSKTTVFVPAAVNVGGVGGAFFQTDLWVGNTSASDFNFVVTYLPSGNDNSSRAGVTLTLRAHSQVAIANVLHTLFQTTGTGALRIDSDSPFLAASRTYNSANPAGTFGVGLAGRPLSASVSRGIILGLSNNAAYRSNVAVMNPQPVPVTVTFQLFRADGTALGSQRSQRLEPLDWFQANNIFGFLGASTEDNAYVTVSSPDGSFFSYASVVDQKSGDGTVIEAAGY